MNAIVPQQTEELNFKEKISYLIRELGSLDQIRMPLKHYFQPGIYIREIFMPAGTHVIGKTHKTKHFNIIQKGTVQLISEDGVQVLTGPCTFVSDAGVQKVLYIVEDTVWSTVHLTNETNLEILERELIEFDENNPVLDRTEELKDIEHAARDVAALPNDGSAKT